MTDGSATDTISQSDTPVAAPVVDSQPADKALLNDDPHATVTVSQAIPVEPTTIPTSPTQLDERDVYINGVEASAGAGFQLIFGVGNGVYNAGKSLIGLGSDVMQLNAGSLLYNYSQIPGAPGADVAGDAGNTILSRVTPDVINGITDAATLIKSVANLNSDTLTQALDDVIVGAGNRYQNATVLFNSGQGFAAGRAWVGGDGALLLLIPTELESLTPSSLGYLRTASEVDNTVKVAETTNFTTVYRVEGDTNTRISVDTSGNVALLGDNTLWLNFGNEDRAQQFLQQKIDGGMPNPVVKSFQIPAAYLTELQTTAVPESLANQFPTLPIISRDVNVTGNMDQFGLRSNSIKNLQSLIQKGSGQSR